MFDKIARAFRRAGFLLPWGHMANITKAERERRALEAAEESRIEEEARTARKQKKAVSIVPPTAMLPAADVVVESQAAASIATNGPCVLMHRDGIEAEVRKGPSVEIMLAQGWMIVKN